MSIDSSQPDDKLPDDTQQWLAFRYLTGELSADEAEQFEQQMLNDMDLCAVVADLSLLTSVVTEAALKATKSEPAATQRPVLKPSDVAVTATNRQVSRFLAVVATACCCAAAILFVAPQEITPQPPALASSTVSLDVSDADFLVNVWADSVDTEPESDAVIAEAAEDSELHVPDWMLAALSGTDLPESDGSDASDPDLDSPEVL